MSVDSGMLFSLLGVKSEREWSSNGSAILSDTLQSISGILDTKVSVLNNEERVLIYVGNKVVGLIGKAKFNNDTHGVTSQNHLYKYIDPEYRGKGLSSVLMSEYVKAGFQMPPFEYTRKGSVIRLMKKFGYYPSTIIINGNEIPYEEKYFANEINGVVKLERNWD